MILVSAVYTEQSLNAKPIAYLKDARDSGYKVEFRIKEYKTPTIVAKKLNMNNIIHIFDVLCDLLTILCLSFIKIKAKVAVITEGNNTVKSRNVSLSMTPVRPQK